MNAPAVVTRNTVPALAMSEGELMSVLQSSVYPGAKPESIKLVINVCRASGKDPLKKPYHIVPMQVSTGEKDDQGWDKKVWRDVVMPGINDYRTDAARTGQHAGTSEPEFGPDVTEKLGDVQITFPAWCRVTVKRRLASGEIVEFSATERWKENYATKSSKTMEPNAMWKRRPYAQLSKCAEAQALRKGFPEVGALATAEEMEGKELDGDFQGATIDGATGEIDMPRRKEKPAPEQTKPDAEKPPQPGSEKPQPTGPVSGGQIAYLRKKLADAGVSEESVCERFKIAKLEEISAVDWDTQKADLLAMG